MEAVRDPQPVAPSQLRAWVYLIVLSLQRQMRFRQMMWIALALLLGSTLLVGARTATGRWGMHQWRSRSRTGPATYQEILYQVRVATSASTTLSPPTSHAVHDVVHTAYQALLDRSDFVFFSNLVVFGIFVSFLLPLWSLSFATEALGGERESQSLLWLLTRPLPRPSIYLAKYVALLPWTVTYNVGGFALLCLAAGAAGREALALFWPAVLTATLAFAALFHLIGAIFRRPAIMALVYSFFLEMILGNMPGYLKRVSISFYTRCMMYEAALGRGVQPEKPTVFLPVDGTTAQLILLGVTLGLLVLGMILFGRKEYVSVE